MAAIKVAAIKHTNGMNNHWSAQRLVNAVLAKGHASLTAPDAELLLATSGDVDADTWKTLVERLRTDLPEVSTTNLVVDQFIAQIKKLDLPDPDRLTALGPEKITVAKAAKLLRGTLEQTLHDRIVTEWYRDYRSWCRTHVDNRSALNVEIQKIEADIKKRAGKRGTSKAATARDFFDYSTRRI